MKSYARDNRLNHRIKHERERKPITPNMASSTGDKNPVGKTATTSGTKTPISNPTRSESGSKPNAVTTPPKGSKRS